jgi:hypothetical protein
MRQSFPALRRLAVVTVAILSLVGGAFLVWGLAGREQIAFLNNAYLLGIVALLLLPGAALAAWDLDRRACLRRGPELEEPAARVHEADQGREPRPGHRHRVRAGAEAVR